MANLDSVRCTPRGAMRQAGYPPLIERLALAVKRDGRATTYQPRSDFVSRRRTGTGTSDRCLRYRMNPQQRERSPLLRGRPRRSRRNRTRLGFDQRHRRESTMTAERSSFTHGPPARDLKRFSGSCTSSPATPWFEEPSAIKAGRRLPQAAGRKRRNARTAPLRPTRTSRARPVPESWVTGRSDDRASVGGGVTPAARTMTLATI